VHPPHCQEGKYSEIFYDKNSGLIQGLGPATIGQPFFIGAAVIEQEALAEVPIEGPADFLETILQPAIRNEKAGVFVSERLWFDMGSPSLWLNTHLKLIDLVEKGDLSQRWRKRIESVNIRKSEGIWVSKSYGRPLKTANWVAPCYWHPGDPECNVRAPRLLGPCVVLYGAIPGRIEDALELSHGIGFNGHWVST
jgi:hypothetical protein